MKKLHPSLTPTDRRLLWQTRSAVAMLAAGFALSVAGFCVPPVGEVSDSVLWIFSQCLLYAGSIFGVTTYVQTVVDRRLQRPHTTSPATPDAEQGNRTESKIHS